MWVFQVTLRQVEVVLPVLHSLENCWLLLDRRRPRSPSSIRAWWRYALLGVLRSRSLSRDFWFDRQKCLRRLQRVKRRTGWYESSSEWLTKKFVDWWRSSSSEDEQVKKFVLESLEGEEKAKSVVQAKFSVQSLTIRVESLLEVSLQFSGEIRRGWFVSVLLDSLSFVDSSLLVRGVPPIFALRVQSASGGSTSFVLRSSSCEVKCSPSSWSRRSPSFVHSLEKILRPRRGKTLALDIEVNEMKVIVLRGEGEEEETVEMQFSQMKLINEMAKVDEEGFSTPSASPTRPSTPIVEIVHQSLMLVLKDIEVESVLGEERTSLINRCELTMRCEHPLCSVIPLTNIEVSVPRLHFTLPRWLLRHRRRLPSLRPHFRLRLSDLTVVVPDQFHLKVDEVDLFSTEQLEFIVSRVTVCHCLDLFVRSVRLFESRLSVEGVEIGEPTNKRRRGGEEEEKRWTVMEKVLVDLQVKWTKERRRLNIQAKVSPVNIRFDLSFLSNLSLPSLREISSLPVALDLQVTLTHLECLLVSSSLLIRLENSFLSFSSPSLFHSHCSSLDVLDTGGVVRSLVVTLPNG